MEQRLHKTQAKLLELLRDNADDPLTVRELMELLGASSTSVVQHHIRQLEKGGYLRRNPLNPHDYQILADEPEKKITYLNLYGLARCGPSGSLLDGNPVDRIPIATQILGFPSEQAFLVRAKGDSMSPMINDKDLVIARRASVPGNGDIVVCVNNGEALIKKLKVGPEGVILRSVNDLKYEPFHAANDFHVEGIVRGVISYLRNP